MRSERNEVTVAVLMNASAKTVDFETREHWGPGNATHRMISKAANDMNAVFGTLPQNLGESLTRQLDRTAAAFFNHQSLRGITRQGCKLAYKMRAARELLVAHTRWTLFLP